MSNPGNTPRFRLTIDGFAEEIHVLSFKGSEGISQVFRFDIELVCEHPELDLDALMHRQAYLAFDALSADGGGIHGQVYGVGRRAIGRRLTHYTLCLVPRLQYLQHRTNQRIYQQLSAAQIIAKLLDEHGIAGQEYETHQHQPCPVRDYCVQYDETDLHFIQRLCEEEGLHFHFLHSPQRHVLVFSDDQSVFPRLAEPTPYARDNGMVADGPAIHGFTVRLETRTESVASRDYNFRTPSVQLEAKTPQASPVRVASLEDYAYPGRFKSIDDGTRLSRRALERHRTDYEQAEGRSDETRLVSGHMLRLERHLHKQWNDLWLLTAIEHEGKQPQVLEESGAGDLDKSADGFDQGYRNHFFCTPRFAFFRPPLKHPKPQVLGSQTAQVTGPAGEEIHCDAYGRVKVQFHWDREGQGDDTSSCWLRVASGWAGKHYGGLCIPRVGMEVLVSFEEGDPDRPLVTGCVYHRLHPTPYELPVNQTRTVFKSLSSPGGDGFNELRIEDRAGAEQIYINAQRDWDQHIKHDQNIHVGHERHDTVEHNVYSELKAEEHRVTHGNRLTEVRKDDHLSVGHQQHIKAGKAILTRVGNEIHIKSGDKIVVEAAVELTIRGGGHFIKLDPAGIKASGAWARVNAGGAPGKGSGIGIQLPILPGEADKDKAGDVMAGALVNAPPEPAAPPVEAPKNFCIQMKRPYESAGIAGQPYVLEVEGTTYRGTTSADGFINQAIEHSAKTATLKFYPFGEQSQPWEWQLDLRTQHETTEISGIQSRLKNLGFYHANVDGVDGGKTKHAIRCFQRACQSTETDELSASDLQRLQEHHTA